MKVKDLIAEDIEIDVCDDYDERCWIAKSGAYKLSDEAKQKFHRALDIEVHINPNGFGNLPIAILECETAEDARACKEFFFSLAGYCAADDYDRWFEEV